MKTLIELVELYNKNISREEDWKLSDFKNKNKKLEELIEDAVWGRLPDLKRDRHQNRIPKNVLEEVTKSLLEPIIIQELMKSKRFDDIFTIVYCLKIPKFNSLSVYDTSLRLGTMMGLYPDVVYLHCGALEGAVKLIGKENIQKHIKNFSDNREYPYIYQECLPVELQKLEPYHIENFLCFNKNKF